jgi:hypothetical protein
MGQEINSRGDKWLFASCWTFIWVHFMALLIPQLDFLYYFKNYKVVTVKNFIIASSSCLRITIYFQLLLPLTMAFFAKQRSLQLTA